MAKSRYVVQWDEQPIHLTKVLCSLLESQTLVDLTVNCNSYTIKVHKCVLAANSSYFRDHLQKDMSIDRVVINSIKHIVLKSLIEYMYCGETSIPDENIEELIAAAKFFSIRGISAIIPQKLGGNHTSNQGIECNLASKPPLFFSKNDKKYTFKEKDYTLYDNVSRRKHSHTKVTDEAHVALAKEEAASRFALEMLKKDINNTSNVFVIDETCTEATVETNLTAQYENTNNMMQIQEYVIQNEIKNDASELEQNNIDMNLLPKTKQSPNDDRMNDLNNVPMLYKPNENAYVNVNVSNQILESLQNSHAITYHVMPEDGNVDFQQYICNNFGQYSVQIEQAQPEPTYEIVNNMQNETKKPLTFTQLVADTVSSEYDTSYSENSNPYDTLLTKNEENIQYVSSESVPPKIVTEELFSSNYNESYGTELLDVQGKDVLIENIVTPKKKRGRPPKRKFPEKHIENESSYLPEQKVLKVTDYIPTEVMDQNVDTVIVDLNSTESDKENENPNDQRMNYMESNTNVCAVSTEQNASLFNENRRQTRSSFKFQ